LDVVTDIARTDLYSDVHYWLRLPVGFLVKKDVPQGLISGAPFFT